MPLSVREWKCPGGHSVNHRDTDAARNIRDTDLADSLGRSGCIRSSPVVCPASEGSTAKGKEKDTHFLSIESKRRKSEEKVEEKDTHKFVINN